MTKFDTLCESIFNRKKIKTKNVDRFTLLAKLKKQATPKTKWKPEISGSSLHFTNTQKHRDLFDPSGTSINMGGYIILEVKDGLKKLGINITTNSGIKISNLKSDKGLATVDVSLKTIEHGVITGTFVVDASAKVGVMTLMVDSNYVEIPIDVLVFV